MACWPHSVQPKISLAFLATRLYMEAYTPGGTQAVMHCFYSEFELSRHKLALEAFR